VTLRRLRKARIRPEVPGSSCALRRITLEASVVSLITEISPRCDRQALSELVLRHPIEAFNSEPSRFGDFDI
jgi:hypothetical protein